MQDLGVIAQTYIGKIPDVIDDALQDGWECHHGICSPPVDGFMGTLKKSKAEKWREFQDAKHSLTEILDKLAY